MKLLLLQLLVWTSSLSSLTTAFFTAEDSCRIRGDPAPIATELPNDAVVEIPFDESNVTFTINDLALTETTDIILEVDGDYKFAIAAVNDTTFVGGYIRVEQGNDATNFVLLPDVDDGATNASTCRRPVQAITQIETESPKTSLSGGFTSFTTESSIVVDVTVVLTNTTDELTYTYTQFNLRTVAASNDTEPETTPPTAAPVALPMGVQTLVPTTTVPPSLSPEPTFAEECLVCGSADLAITLPDATLVFNNNLVPCSLLVGFAEQRLFAPDECDEVAPLIQENCACEAVNTTTTAPTNETMVDEPMGPADPTDAPEGLNTTTSAPAATPTVDREPEIIGSDFPSLMPSMAPSTILANGGGGGEDEPVGGGTTPEAVPTRAPVAPTTRDVASAAVGRPLSPPMMLVGVMTLMVVGAGFV